MADQSSIKESKYKYQRALSKQHRRLKMTTIVFAFLIVAVLVHRTVDQSATQIVCVAVRKFVSRHGWGLRSNHKVRVNFC